MQRHFHFELRMKLTSSLFNSSSWIFIPNIQSCSGDRFLSLESGWEFQPSARISMHDQCGGQKYTVMPRYDSRCSHIICQFLLDNEKVRIKVQLYYKTHHAIIFLPFGWVRSCHRYNFLYLDLVVSG